MVQASKLLIPNIMFKQTAFILLILSAVYLGSCGQLTESGQAESISSEIVADSTLRVSKGRELALTATPTGKWRLIESKLGNSLPMSEDIVGNLTLEFTGDGQVISDNPELGPATFSLEEKDGRYVIEDGIGGQVIQQFDANRMVITYEIDQETVTQIYEAVE